MASSAQPAGEWISKPDEVDTTSDIYLRSIPPSTANDPPPHSDANQIDLDRRGFPLDTKFDYDSMPDVKAYLALVGTTTDRVTWFHRPTMNDLSPVETLEKKQTDEAVVRGICYLQHRRRLGKGLFVKGHTDEDAKTVQRWKTLRQPWVPYTGILRMTRTARDKFYLSCMSDDIYDDGPYNPVHGNLVFGNVRLYLGPNVTQYPPSSMEFIFMVRSAYGESCHPMDLLTHIIGVYEDYEYGLEFFNVDSAMPNRSILTLLINQNATCGLIQYWFKRS